MHRQWKSFTTRPELIGNFGMVSSTHWLGSAVGMAVLEAGGNAFDAAVATAFTLQVAEPHLNGPAGEAPVLLFDAAVRRTRVLCGQGPAPKAADIAAFEDLELEMIPGTGLLPACIPGAFDTWMLLLLEHGTMRLAEVLAYAIHYARSGVPVVPQISNTIETVAELFRSRWRASAELYLVNDQTPAIGMQLRNERLAQTYERILSEARAADRETEILKARDVWRRGFVAEAIINHCQQEAYDSTGRHHSGFLSEEDLAEWEAHFEEPASYDYHGFTVMKAGPWSQGPVALQQLALLKDYDLGRLDPVGPDFIHLVVEASKLAFADREAFYGDPRYVEVPLEHLLSDSYNSERRGLLRERASHDLRPGEIPGYGGELVVPSVKTEMEAGGSGEPTVSNLGEVKGDTCHFDIIDRHGNMVSATPSGGWLQSSPAIAELGFPLGTRGQMFWLIPGLPNSLAPGKRPRTTLTPSMALRDGLPYLSWGTPGGDQQDQWSVQFFLRHVHHGLNLQQAIDAPAWHSEHFPSSFWPRAARPGVLVVEERLGEATINELRRRGHEVQVGPLWSEGRLTAASQEGGLLRAAANPRGMQGYAAGR